MLIRNWQFLPDEQVLWQAGAIRNALIVNQRGTLYIFAVKIECSTKKWKAMPNYQYRCKNCSYEFEELQRFSEPVLVTCPSCNTENLIRLMSGGAGLHFKGSGFYLTDYKKSNSTSPTAETKPAAESGTKTETKKTETKSSDSKEKTK